jgi:hypothetical protein
MDVDIESSVKIGLREIGFRSQPRDTTRRLVFLDG